MTTQVNDKLMPSENLRDVAEGMCCDVTVDSQLPCGHGITLKRTKHHTVSALAHNGEITSIYARG
jgi:hypothetical protein